MHCVMGWEPSGRANWLWATRCPCASGGLSCTSLGRLWGRPAGHALQGTVSAVPFSYLKMRVRARVLMSMAHRNDLTCRPSESSATIRWPSTRSCMRSCEWVCPTMNRYARATFLPACMWVRPGWSYGAMTTGSVAGPGGCQVLQVALTLCECEGERAVVAMG